MQEYANNVKSRISTTVVYTETIKMEWLAKIVSKHLKWSIMAIDLTNFSCWLFSQIAPSLMFSRVLNTPLYTPLHWTSFFFQIALVHYLMPQLGLKRNFFKCWRNSKSKQKNVTCKHWSRLELTIKFKLIIPLRIMTFARTRFVENFDKFKKFELVVFPAIQ